MRRRRSVSAPTLAASLTFALFWPGVIQTTTAALQSEQLAHTTEAYSFKPDSGEAVNAVLGSFLVSENRNIKNSPRIRLKYVLLPSTNDKPGPPIVYLAGGPGGAGTDAGRGRRFSMFARLRELGDVILFDQRGTGMSNSLPVGGSWDIPLDIAATRKVYEAAAMEALRESLEIWKTADVDLSAYNTESSADDMADLCKVLDAPKIRIVGISYGTHLGLSFMRRHPDKLDRIVLAGVEGPDHTLKMPQDQQALLEQIQVWIDIDENAKAAYPDLVATTTRLLDRLRDNPHVIEAPRKIVITEFDVQYFLAAMLRGPTQFASIPKTIFEMENGDFRVLARFVSALRSGEFPAMGIAMDAASSATQARLQKIESQRTTTVLGDAINCPMNVVIPELKQLDLGSDFRSPVVSSIPTLAVSGTADGRTPPGNATEVLKTLSNGQHLIVDGAGHSDPLFLSSPQIVESIVGFLQGKRLVVTEITLPAIKFPLPGK